jgi:hypothetical protein
MDNIDYKASFRESEKIIKEMSDVMYKLKEANYRYRYALHNVACMFTYDSGIVKTITDTIKVCDEITKDI